MYISSFHIDGFGIFSDVGVSSLPPGLVIFLGRNEAGKSTCLDFFRAMLFGYPAKREGRRNFEPLRGGMPGGSLILRPQDNPAFPQEIMLSRRPGKGDKGLSLHTPDGTPISPEIYARLLGGITADVYRAVYGFSLSELENFACLNAEGVRNALYSASFGPGIEPPGKVLQELLAQENRLYSPTRKKSTLMSGFLEELEAIDSRIRVLAEEAAGFDEASLALASTGKDLANVRETRKKLGEEQRLLERRHDSWRHWHELRLIEMRLAGMEIHAPENFPDDGRDKLRDLQKERAILERQLAEQKQKLAGSEARKNAVDVNQALADALPFLRRVAERKSGYRQARSRIEGEEQSLARSEKDLTETLAQLGPDWDCRRIRNTNRSLFAREDLEKQAREMAAASSAYQACVDALTRSNRDVESLGNAVLKTKESLAQLPEPLAVLDGAQRDELRQNMARLDECVRLGPMRERALERARTDFARSFEKLHFASFGQANDLDDGDELEEDIRKAEEDSRRVEKERALLDTLLARQDEALALAGEVREKISAVNEVEKARKQAEDEAEAIRAKMDETRNRLRSQAGPGRDALDARAAALRSLRSASAALETDKKLLQDLDERIQSQHAPKASKSLPLLIFGGLLIAAGAAILLAHWFLQISELAITPTLSLPVTIWSGYGVLACGVAFLAGGLPRSGPEARQYANEMKQLAMQRESRSLELGKLGNKVLALCEQAGIDSADPITLDATEVLLEREREQCFHEEQIAREMTVMQESLAKVRQRAQDLSVEAHAREQEAQQSRHRWHGLMQVLNLSNVPLPENAENLFARAETARMAYGAVDNAIAELNQAWEDMRDLENRISSIAPIAELLRKSEGALSLGEAVRQILESCREADACRDQRIRMAADLQNQEAALTRARQSQQEAAAELKSCESRLAQSRSAWNQSVSLLGLGEDLNPETVREAFKCMENCLQIESRMQACRTELERCAAEMAALEKPLAEKARELGQEPQKDGDSIDWLATLDKLLVQATEMEEAKSAVNRLNIQIDRDNDDLRATNAALDTLDAQEKALLAQAGAADADQFMRLAAARNEEEALARKRADLMDILKLAARNQPLDEFLASFGDSTEDELGARLEQLGAELEKLAREEDDLAARKAGLDARVNALCRSDELADLRREKAILLEKMENAANAWAVPALASAILARAKKVFEAERQPEIVETASALFASITNDRWKGLGVSLEDSTLLVLPRHGEPVSPDLLSRGAQEQAYLALRLAYIIDHAKHDQTLPIVMDEILVNFDPERAKRAAMTFASLVDGAQKQQIFYFTCQPAMAEMLAETSPGALCCKVEDGKINILDLKKADFGFGSRS